jgi:hypothetical protein
MRDRYQPIRDTQDHCIVIPAEGCTMNKHSDRPARQEADMLESLFEERRRSADQARLRPPRRGEDEKPDQKPDGRNKK